MHKLCLTYERMQKNFYFMRMSKTRNRFLVDKPVIAVPTSVGYGAALGGLTALLGMLTSCASNVTVVNIDNGFGAAHVATLINRL